MKENVSNFRKYLPQELVRRIEKSPNEIILNCNKCKRKSSCRNLSNRLIQIDIQTISNNQLKRKYKPIWDSFDKLVKSFPALHIRCNMNNEETYLEEDDPLFGEENDNRYK